MNKLISSVLHSLFVERQNENWIFSPASYLEVMSLLSLCVKDENLEQLLAVAPDISEKQAEGLETHNVILYTSEYEQTLNETVVKFLTEERGANFESFNGPEVIDRINAIVREKTNGKIDNLVGPGDFSDALKFILLNCVYFKQAWLYKFSENWQTEPFYGATKVQVKYLNHQIVGERYYEDSEVDIVELPYKESDVACYIIVPKNGLFRIFNNLDDTINKIALVKSGLDVNLTVPSFKTETTIPLKEFTRIAGVKKIFTDSQDWSIVDWTKTDSQMVFAVSAIRQKAYIDFTKDGTEVAAATTIGISGGYSGAMSFVKPPPIKYVRADKPFLYILADKNNLKPLFVGVINDVPDSSFEGYSDVGYSGIFKDLGPKTTL